MQEGPQKTLIRAGGIAFSGMSFCKRTWGATVSLEQVSDMVEQCQNKSRSAVMAGCVEVRNSGWWFGLREDLNRGVAMRHREWCREPRHFKVNENQKRLMRKQRG